MQKFYTIAAALSLILSCGTGYAGSEKTHSDTHKSNDSHAQNSDTSKTHSHDFDSSSSSKTGSDNQKSKSL